MAAKKVFMLNGHAAWPFAKGRLNKTMFDLAKEHFVSLGCEIKETIIDSEDPYDANAEVDKFVWADLVFFQTPAYWFGVPWQFKKYIDEVYSPGMDGRMCKGDGRHRDTPQDGYGTGGTLKGRYMLSLTYNTPSGAFNREDQYLMQGRSVDEAWFFFHALNRFCNLQQVPDSTFCCFDVMKNPDVENDIVKFKAHLQKLFPTADAI